MTPDIKLTLFSIGLQAAIGTMAASMIAGKMTGKADYKNASLASSLLAVVGFLAFVSFLGRPTNIFNAISRFSHSWLSRELVFALLFIGFALIHVVVQYTNPAIKRFGWLASAVGVLDIFSMIMVYMSTSRQSWQGMYTAIDFLAVTILLGIAIFIALHHKELEVKVIKPYSLLGLACLVILFVAAGFNYSNYELGNIKLLLVVHLLLLIIGAALSLLPSLKGSAGNKASVGTIMAYAGAIALCGGLTISRYLFYAVQIIS